MRITAAESQIMEALWRAGPLTPDEIVRDVGGAQNWGAATVKTLITRLLKKKALASEREAGRTRYRPLISREEFLHTESQSFLDRLFDGQLAPRLRAQRVAPHLRLGRLRPDRRRTAHQKRLVAAHIAGRAGVHRETTGVAGQAVADVK